MAESGIRGWRRVAIVLLLGPLPVGVLALLSEKFGVKFTGGEVAIPAAFGATWGLTAGVLRKSLLRAFVGLNVGAALGYSFGTMVVLKANQQWTMAGLLILHGVILSAIINASRKSFFTSVARGAFAGAASFGAIGGAALLVMEFLRPNAIGWTVMAMVPFGLGMYLYLRLIAAKPDALPSEAAAGEPHG